MATRPTNDLLVWANTDVDLPNLAGPNKTEPSADLVAKGWDFKQKPSADEFNYILNNLGEWVEYLKTFTSEGTPLNTPSTLVKRDAAGNFAASMITSNLTGNVTGNADTASKLATARTVAISGDVTGSATFDGSTNTTITTTVADNSHSHTSSNISDATSLNNANMVMRRDNNGDVAARYFVGALTGNSSTSSKWQTPRTLELTGSVTGSVSVDGSGNVSMATSISSSSGVAILTGTVLNGGTIPLPAGYTEEQCKWMVSPLDTNVNGTSWDWAEGINARHIETVCMAYLSRNVVAYTRIWRDGTNDYYSLDASANYIIIGVK